MSDFEHPRPRDSTSISATSGSGSRTVRVRIEIVYYSAARHERQIWKFKSNPKTQPRRRHGVVRALPLPRLRLVRIESEFASGVPHDQPACPHGPAVGGKENR